MYIKSKQPIKFLFSYWWKGITCPTCTMKCGKRKNQGQMLWGEDFTAYVAEDDRICLILAQRTISRSSTSMPRKKIFYRGWGCYDWWKRSTWPSRIGSHAWKFPVKADIRDDDREDLVTLWQLSINSLRNQRNHQEAECQARKVKMKTKKKKV